MAAGNLAFFKNKFYDERRKKDDEGGDVISALAPWIRRLPPAIRLPLDDWVVKNVSDMRACYAAFFLGSGCINNRPIKLRRLVFGHVFTCCRSRLVAYLVPRAPVFRQRICALITRTAQLSPHPPRLSSSSMVKRSALYVIRKYIESFTLRITND